MAMVKNGRYPTDQKLFVIDCIRYGVDAAVTLAGGADIRPR
jgi:hypothetical protein